MKQQSLKTKWMMLTTTITFIIFALFSMFIIYFISLYLKDQETKVATRSAYDTINLLESKTLGQITSTDINASINDNQKIILYDKFGKQIYEDSHNDHLDHTPNIKGVNKLKVYETKVHNKTYLVVLSPINTSYFKGYEAIVHPLDSYEAIIKFMIILATLFGLTALFLIALISYIFSSQITKPITILSDKMKQIRRDGFQEKLVATTNYEETDDMIQTFNNMMEQLEISFEQQKQFVEDASHELRTPLQIIQGHLNLIQRWGKNNPEVLEESLDISIEEMDRITKLVEELLLLSKDARTSTGDDIDIVDINYEIQSRIKSLKKLHPDYTFDFNSNYNAIRMNINRFHFEQMLLIFIDNAMKYDTKNKNITINTNLKNRNITLDIIDHGMGIPKKDLEFIFDRFYRVDKSRSRKEGGNGLGLSIAKKLVNSYDGTVKVDSIENEYTKISVVFKESFINK
ncbi:HAMP domain-containing sensor histidine kinase [Mammaliicoccus stepanovicii]|uniref:Signal transduction histidine-protein kinase ArlS n=1 Tax=Mammaliicoccus stepanovicii TaxID=643214 RepID=A0A239ZBD3_9STAP|nr:HAMP domain-containing histidine kinase [Mammaliicoccus stepanovicii]PNZ73875.1 two-component sensor histidine kinase [Mammaliicoccus stepanovicii]GGI42168.1 signal transduction histidine-protein kinase ArlS [Mammaliicoccus stepanovicii]SNV68187.1 putative sensor protein histidine kinase [Mammaliicoccus stepanovicii]